MAAFIANDQFVSLNDAEALLREVGRLRAEVDRLRRKAGELERLAYRDPLVDVLNRRGFLASLQNLIARVERYRESAAMLFVDVDGLKKINDQFGHESGDAAIAQIARMIVGSVRNSDCVGRLGGDEFGVLLERANELDGWQMGLRIVEQVVGSEFCVNGSCLPLSVAVGVGVIRSGDDPQSVMSRADKSMYRWK